MGFPIAPQLSILATARVAYTQFESLNAYIEILLQNLLQHKNSNPGSITLTGSSFCCARFAESQSLTQGVSLMEKQKVSFIVQLAS